MLPTLISRLTAAIAANESAMRDLDRSDRIRLLPLTDRLQRYRDRAQLGIDQPHRRIETETLLGPNMRGPAIEDLIRQCEAIRKSRPGGPHALTHPTEAAGAANRLNHQQQRSAAA